MDMLLAQHQHSLLRSQRNYSTSCTLTSFANPAVQQHWYEFGVRIREESSPTIIMASYSNDLHEQPPSPPQDLSASGLTLPSDSEPYSSISPPSSSPPQSNNNGEQPVIIYQPPTVWSLLRGAAINLLLPFVNGLMLGFGELFAHEIGFRLGWSQTNVRCFLWCIHFANNIGISPNSIEQACRSGC